MGNHIINPTLWPPNSPYLNPVDYKILECMQEMVYKTKVRDVEDLRKRIAQAWNDLVQRIGGAWVAQATSLRRRIWRLTVWVGLHMGGDLGGLGAVLPKIWGWWTAHASVSSIFLRDSVVGCARKYEQSKRKCHQGIIFWNKGFFSWRMGHVWHFTGHFTEQRYRKSE